MKERYIKPVMKPVEQDNGLLREEYQRPDMEVVPLRTTTVIVTSDGEETTTATSAVTVPSISSITISIPPLTPPQTTIVPPASTLTIIFPTSLATSPLANAISPPDDSIRL